MDDIYCVGDSHVCVFSGTNEIYHNVIPTVYENPNCFITNVDPILAYNIPNKEHQSHHNMINVINMVPKGSYLLLSAGSIDCYKYIPKYNNLIEVVERYFGFVKEIKEMGYKVIVYGPVFMNLSEGDSERPEYYNATDIYINLTRFEYEMGIRCDDANIPFINNLPFNHEQGLTDNFYLMHLSNKVLPTQMKKLEIITNNWDWSK